MENEIKLKIGDRVLFSHHSSVDKWENRYHIYEGNIYIISAINGELLYIIKKHNKIGVWTLSKQLQKVTGKERELEKLLLWNNYKGTAVDV